jgi:hypothetical protein
MSKGSVRRPENPDKEPGAYERGYDQIEWPNRKKKPQGFERIGEFNGIEYWSHPDVPEDEIVVLNTPRVVPPEE